MRLRPKGKHAPRIREGGMPPETATIAASEISGIPIEEMCNWVLVVSRHQPDGLHEVGVIPRTPDWKKAAVLLEVAARDCKTPPR